MKKIHMGFTIVELLIVIVVIGILAAVTIVAYNGIQGRSQDASVQSDLRQIGTKIAMYAVENSAYPTGNQLVSLKLSVSKNAYRTTFPDGSLMYNILYCWPPSNDPHNFSVIAFSKSGKAFQYKKSGVSEYTGPDSGTVAICAASGVTVASGSMVDWFYKGTWAYV